MKNLLRSFALLALSVSAAYGQYAYKWPLTTKTSLITADQTSFPVRVDVTDNSARFTGSGGAVVYSDGRDIRCFSDSALTSALPWALTSYDSSAGHIRGYCQLPSISTSSTVTFYIAYGNASVSSASDAKAVWTGNGYVLVVRGGNGSTLDTADYSASALTATSNGGATASAGKLDGAMAFTGSTLGVTYGNATALRLASNYTIETWANLPTRTQNTYTWLADYQHSSPNASPFAEYGLMANNGGDQRWNGWFTTSGGAFNPPSLTATSTGWHHIAMTYTAGTQILYVDGSAAATATQAGPNSAYDATGGFVIGNNLDNGAGLNGSVEMVRLSNVARSATWIATQYNMENAATTFLTVGTPIQNVVPTFDVTSKRCTATQCVLQYPAPSAGASCTIQFSELADYSVPVNDINSSLGGAFASANIDTSRNSTFSDATGTLRSVVIGQRISQQGADNKFYSRANQTDTRHFYKFTCPSAIYTGEVRTANIPLGNNYPDMPPFDSNGFGNYAWPTIDWSDASKLYIDPMTGVGLRRATSPGFNGGRQDAKVFGAVIDAASAWTNASNANSGTATDYATYAGSATSSAPLQLLFDWGNFNAPNNFVGYFGYMNLDDIGVTLYGTGSDSGVAANRTVSMCLSYLDSGATCDSSVVDAVLPASGGSIGVLAPSNYPTAILAGWQSKPPIRQDLMVGSGVASITGSAMTVTGCCSGFNPRWKAGAKIWIAGSSCANNMCTVSSVQDEEHLTLVESPGPLTNVNFKTRGMALKLWKKTGTGSISISAAYSYAYSYHTDFPPNGAFQQCSQSTFTVSKAADGVTDLATPVQARLCTQRHYNNTNKTAIYMLIPATGETRLLTPNIEAYTLPAGEGSAPLGTGSDANDYRWTGFQLPWGAFDDTDGVSYYPWASCNQNTTSLCIWKCTYQGVGKAYTHPFYPTSVAPGMDPAIPGGYTPYSDIQMQCTNITKPSQGKEVLSQFHNHPKWDATIWGQPGVQFLTKGKATLAAGVLTAGYGPGLLAFLDVASGQITNYGDSWSTAPARWGWVHGEDLFTNWMVYYLNIIGDYGGNDSAPDNASRILAGPFQTTATQLYKGGTWTSDTSFKQDLMDVCSTDIPQPWKDEGAVGSNCLKFRAPQVCSHTPHANEKAKWPCPYNSNWSQLQQVQVGDLLQLYDSNSITYHDSGDPDPAGQQDLFWKKELWRVLKATDLGTGQWEFEVHRNLNNVNSFRILRESAGFMIIAASENAWADTSASGPGITFYRDPTHMAQDHGDLGTSETPGADTFVRGASTDGAFQPRSGTMAQMLANQVQVKGIPVDTPWAGAKRGALTFQSYPAMQQRNAPTGERHWFMDAKHLNQSTAPGYDSGALISTAQTYSLVGGTSSVYKFTAIAGQSTLDYKRTPLGAFAGYHLLKEVSGPGSLVSDATPWQFCYTLNAGECFAGSSVGEVYAVIPQATLYDKTCRANDYEHQVPCVYVANALYANAIQVDATRTSYENQFWRRLTMGFSGPGRQFTYMAAQPEATGKWALMPGYLLDGAQTAQMLIKIPRWPVEENATNRRTFVPVQVKLAGRSDITAAEVEFGYAEFGSPSSLYCMGRQETCVTVASGSAPYRFASETASRNTMNTTTGGTVTIPALPGHVVYYRWKRYAGSTLVETSPIQTLAIP
jgi:hypothetical protein